MPKRNDRVAPPARGDQWEIRFGISEAADGWEELCQQAPGNTRDAWDALSRNPRDRSNPKRQHQLRADFAVREFKGRKLEQWQYEVTGGGRIWYCPDDANRTVWLMRAQTGHPKETE